MTTAALAAVAALGFGLPSTFPETGESAEAAPAGAVELPAASATAPEARPERAEAAPAAVEPAVTTAAPAPALETYTGSASYYADKFEGRTTASGVPFRQARMWAAHKKLPFGTQLRVTNLSNGSQIEVEVVDRGPYAHGRILDLSRTAARKLGFLRAGHTRVKVEVISRP